MKRMIIVAITILSTASLFGAAADFDNPVAKGRWGIFGDLETSSHDATFKAPHGTIVDGGEYNIDLGAGYSVIDNLVLTFGYNIDAKHNTTKNPAGTWSLKDEESGSTMSLGARWYFRDGDQIRPFASLAYLKGVLETKETTTGVESFHHSADHSGFSMQVGVSYWVSHNFCFETHYSMTKLSHADKSNPAFADYDSDSAGLHFGFLWMFSK
tara:strand:+ start:268 stop:903 length:636 start_codon:yes stop_codon:yes gene_type:complete